MPSTSVVPHPTHHWYTQPSTPNHGGHLHPTHTPPTPFPNHPLPAAAERAEQEAIQQHAARELDVAELQQRHTRALQQQAGTGTGTSEAASLQAQVTDTEQRLSEARIAAESTTQRLEALTHEKRDKELQLQALYQKQGAQAQFASKAARDTWLKGEVGKLRAALEESNRAVGDAQQRQEQLEKEVEDLHEVGSVWCGMCWIYSVWCGMCRVLVGTHGRIPHTWFAFVHTFVAYTHIGAPQTHHHPHTTSTHNTTHTGSAQ